MDEPIVASGWFQSAYDFAAQVSYFLRVVEHVFRADCGKKE
jgi:hypothetical protein